MNTGLLQATIAYKFNDLGEPLDVDGQLTSVSGKRQAIALMVGYTNPNELIYEVELYFSPRESIKGEPSVKVSPDSCPVSNFVIRPDYVYLYPAAPSAVVNIYSTFGWVFDGPFDFATISQNSGGPGSTDVTITRTDTLGEGLMNFKDVATGEIKTLRVLNTDALGWILDTGFWNDARIWTPTGLWKY